MTSRARNKTYGRKKTSAFVTSFDKPCLTPQSEKKASIKIDARDALSAINHNVVVQNGTQRNSIGHGDKVQLPEQSENEETCEASSKTECGSETGIFENSDQIRPTRTRSSPKQIDVSKDIRKESSQCVSQPQSPLFLKPLLDLPFISSKVHEFDIEYKEWCKTCTWAKIAQGSYANIYRLTLNTSPEVYTIWKLMPLKPKVGKGSRARSATVVEDAVAELRVLEAMSRSPGFVEFRSAVVLAGHVPEDLKKVDDIWWSGLSDREKTDVAGGDSYEDAQNEYGPDQTWLFIEMTDAGMDLETIFRKGIDNGHKGEVQNGTPSIPMDEVWDIFWGVTEALAHGEDHTGFEHRDLHAGNVCVKKQKRATGRISSSATTLIPRRTGLEVTLIDYTLSRAAIGQSDNSDLDETEVLANSMREKCIFEQESNVQTDQMQYDTYRHMRDIMHHFHKGRQRQDGWKTFMPMTNVLWLHHLLSLLLLQAGILNPEAMTAERHHPDDTIVKLLILRAEISPDHMWQWRFNSATDLIGSMLLDVDDAEDICTALADVSLQSEPQ